MHATVNCRRAVTAVSLLVSLALPGLGFAQEESAKVQRPVASVSNNSQEKDKAERALSWLAAGTKQSDPRKAIEDYEKALTAFRELHNRAREATVLNDLGLAYGSLSQYMRAIGFYEQALAIRREVGDRAGEAITLNNLGGTYGFLSQSTKAIGFYEQALDIESDVGNLSAEGTTLGNLGSAYLSLGQTGKAISAFELALLMENKVGDLSGEVTALNNLGTAYSSLSQYTKAIGFFELVLAIVHELGDRRAEAITLHNLGSAHRSLSQYAKTIGFFERALTIEREVGDRAAEGNTLDSLGSAYSSSSQYARAVGFYEEALAIEREVGHRAGEAATLGDLGAAYRSLSEYAKAIDFYKQALAIEREVGNRAGEGSMLSNLGEAYSALSQYAKAIGLYEQALAIRREVGDRAGEGSTLNNFGLAYYALGQYAKAIDFYTQALAIAREIGSRDGEAVDLNNLGGTYQRLSEYAKAIVFFQQALAIRREIGDRTGEASTLNNLGGTYESLSEYAKAIAFFEEALPIWREVGDRAGEATTLNNMMEALASQQRLRLAVLFGKQAVNAYQQIRQSLSGLDKDTRKIYLEANEQTYRRLADLLLAQDRIAEAQQVLNLLKEEEFFDFVLRDSTQASSLVGRADLTTTEADWDRHYNEVAGRLSELGHERGELVTVETRTAEQEKRLASLDLDLSLAGEAFQKFLARLDTEATRQEFSKEKLNQVKDSEALMETLRELGSNTVAIYEFVTEDKLRLILITPDLIKAAEATITRTDLNTKIVAFRQSLENPRSDPRPLARELYRLVVGPIEKDLAQARAETLMWSLDGALRYLPLAALHDGEHYLVERFRNVVFTPASNANLKDLPAVQWRALGLGVSKAHEGFAALPGAKNELEGIIHDEAAGTHGVLPGAIELDEAFTEEAMHTALRLRYRVVHIASHFRFKPGNETDSYLLLGDGKHMSLADVGKMENPFGGVDLLTLSACDTASGGTGANGKEVEGFAVLAQRKGAKAVIATLWPVADASTNELMQSFYRIRESNKGMPKVEALQEAQLALLHGSTYSHPYYWAPFILIGNSR